MHRLLNLTQGLAGALLFFVGANAVAADPEAAGRGVLVVMNDRIHGAHSLTKIAPLAPDDTAGMPATAFKTAPSPFRTSAPAASNASACAAKTSGARW